MKAKVAHFYGWSDDQIMSMGYHKFLGYWHAITPIEAQKALIDIKVAIYPYLKKNRQKEVFADFKRQANNIDRGGSGLPTMQNIIDGIKRKLGRG